MKMKAIFYGLIAAAVLLMYGLCPAAAQESRKFKVLVVFSYDDVFQWDKDIQEGVESALGKTCEVKYFYIDTYRKPEGGEQKAKEASELYQEYKPDGVIAADDAAQKLFVVPYLKDKVKTPVMFCGVNDEPSAYGYPASNVSGILERLHFKETLAFVQQLIPSVKTFGSMMQESLSGKMLLRQLEDEKDVYTAKFSGFKTVKTIKDVIAVTEEFKSYDTILIASMAGIIGDDGKTLTEKEVDKTVIRTFGKPVVGYNQHHVKYGAICAVAQSGQEQGRTSAEMLLKAMQGTPVSQIPITRNHNGKRMINVTVMKELGIKARPIVLQGAELVKTE